MAENGRVIKQYIDRGINVILHGGTYFSVTHSLIIM